MIQNAKNAGIGLLAFVCACACVLTGSRAALAVPAQIGADGVVVQVVTIAKQDAGTIFRRVHAVLVFRKTVVPVRWPSFIATETSEEHPLYVNLLAAGRDSYNMELGWTSDCIGGSYCHYASVRAGADPFADSGRERVAVKLSDGIAGYFMDSATCGTRCDDAAVGWSEGRYNYLISVKAEKKETLVKIADSAIASGHGQGPADDNKPENGT